MFTKLLIISIIVGIANANANLSESFKKHEIVPDVIEIAPQETLQVLYPGELSVDEGNELTPTQVKEKPTLNWTSKDDEFYTLIMTDPYAPSRKEPVSREWHHWLVVNIPGGHVDMGQVLSDYVGSGPPQGTGLHRYVFLLYKQNGKITPTETVLSKTTGANREKFSAKKFAEKYKLNLFAGNFYQAQYDDYVPTLHAQLGF